MSAEFPIIEKLGGQKAVTEHLLATRVITHPRTVGMWHTRGRISAVGMMALMQMAESYGVTICSHDFEKTRGNEVGSISTDARRGAAA